MSRVIAGYYSGVRSYEAAVSSAQYGTYLDMRTSTNAELEDVLVRVTSVSALHGPPRGPWFEMETRDRAGKVYVFHVYLPKNNGVSSSDNGHAELLVEQS
jgi:hypothetical protein